MRIVLSIISVLVIHFAYLTREVESTDYGCIGCTGILGIMSEFVEYNNHTVEEGFELLCKYLPGKFNEACKLLIDLFGNVVFTLLERKENPETICKVIPFCKNEGNCHLYPINEEWMKDPELSIKHVLMLKEKYDVKITIPSDICEFPPIKPICDIVNRVADHYPAEDLDKDHFSIMQTLRGSSWRGKDCNDMNKNIYPGRRSMGDIKEDANCNGIFGVDLKTGETYENLWCKDTKQMGTAILGDSVGAHFHIPEWWVNPMEIEADTYNNMIFAVENELDWPETSTMTGYTQTIWKDLHGPTNSIYMWMRNKNLCNHRDYQNIAVNGASSHLHSMGNIMKTLARNNTTDLPIMVILSLVGNDVCNRHHTMDNMTTVKDFTNNMEAVLDYLNETLPSGSIVITTGLVDGRILWDNMNDRIHPLSSFLRKVKYSDLYAYMNCLEISPCFGWLNKNETWRNSTTKRAMELSDALENLTNTKKYKNFNSEYIKNPIKDVIDDWVKKGGHGWELIEPVDGFHNSQLGQAIITDAILKLVEKELPHLIPPANPYNADILKVFGDQGGHF